VVALHHQPSILLGTLKGVLKPREGKQLARELEETEAGAASEEDTDLLNGESLRQYERRDKGFAANTNTAGRKNRENESIVSRERRSTWALKLALGESVYRFRFYRINHGEKASG